MIKWIKRQSKQISTKFGVVCLIGIGGFKLFTFDVTDTVAYIGAIAALIAIIWNKD